MCPGLTQNLRKEGRRILEQAAVVFYDAVAQHLTNEEQSRIYAEVASQFGLDLFDATGNVVDNEEIQDASRCLSFATGLPWE